MVEATIKQENKSFVPVTKKDQVYKYLKEHPEANIYELYFTFPGYNKKTLSKYKWEFSITKGLKYYNLLTLTKWFYYEIHLAKSVPVKMLDEKELELVKQLEKILKEG